MSLWSSSKKRYECDMLRSGLRVCKKTRIWPKNLHFQKFFFFLGIFFNEDNITKLIVDNALFEEIVETVGTDSQLLFNQITRNMFFFSFILLFFSLCELIETIFFYFWTCLITGFERDGYLRRCINKRAV